mmetsp:Transcript_8917/g.28969  ORF Transcript_8917/g.28969 Transcript_8917/m.28969 type:complete len:247 (-) Transcript_8917:242-982(-)
MARWCGSAMALVSSSGSPQRSMRSWVLGSVRRALSSGLLRTSSTCFFSSSVLAGSTLPSFAAWWIFAARGPSSFRRMDSSSFLICLSARPVKCEPMTSQNSLTKSRRSLSPHIISRYVSGSFCKASMAAAYLGFVKPLASRGRFAISSRRSVFSHSFFFSSFSRTSSLIFSCTSSVILLWTLALSSFFFIRSFGPFSSPFFFFFFVEESSSSKKPFFRPVPKVFFMRVASLALRVSLTTRASSASL